MRNSGWMFKRVCCLAISIIAGQFSLAQTHPSQATGKNPVFKLEITVTDENGVAVPSALVQLRSSPQANPLRCETDFAGRCTFLNLTPGTYQLRIEKQGFYAYTLAGAQPQTAANIDVTLSHQQEVHEVVNVVESAPEINPAQISSKEQLTGMDIIDMPYPATHDYRNALNFIPGVVQDTSGQPHVAGADTHQTLTVLDGFNVTQPANGLLLVRVSTDAFRSIEVEPSREPAEFGKGSGGVLNLNTGIGDDHYSFIATNFIPSLQTKKRLAFDQWTPRLTFSGPIEKGKAWFFDALEGEYDDFIIPQLPNGQDSDHLWRGGNLAKVQTNLTSRNILTTSFLYNYLDDQYAGLSLFSPALANPTDAESAYIATVKDQHYFGGGELLETGFNFDQYNLALRPHGTAPYFMTTITAGGNYYLDDRTQARRFQLLSNLYLPPREWHGHHDVKLGADVDRIDYDAQFLRRPISFWPGTNATTPNGACPTNADNVPIPITPSSSSASIYPCSRYSVFSGGNYSTTYNTEASAYLEDRWSVTNRLLIEPGARLDWDQIVRNTLFSPRLAGTYVLDNSGNTKLSAGIGLVYDATDLILIARPYAGQRTDYFFDSTGRPLPLNGTACPTQTGTFIPCVNSTFSVDRNTLQAPRFLNWSVGLERKLPKAIFMKAEYLQREGTHDFVYNTLNGLPGGNFVLENTRDDHYHAVQFTLRHSFGQLYMISGSYTRSSTRSNQVLNFNVDSPFLSPQAPGPFPWDTPNRFLSWGFLPFFSLPIIHHLDLAYSAEARNGFPFDVYNNLQELVAPLGSMRFPTYFTLNLHLEKRFHAFGYYWALRGGFDNITGNLDPIFVNADINSPQFLTFSGYGHRAFTSRIRFLGRK
jgi:Carboxypeptidase regulatory-like domain/TonB dependent receptor